MKVIAGRYEGDTGMIVRIENNIAIIFSDLTLHEVCLYRKDVHEWVCACNRCLCVYICTYML